MKRVRFLIVSCALLALTAVSLTRALASAGEGASNQAAPAATPLNTYVVTNTNDSGAGSLRQAILNANASPGLDQISFNIPGAGVHTIAPSSQLPLVSDPVIIDGTTQANQQTCTVPCIELSGQTGTAGDGLVIDAGSSTVQGLVINRFNNGILLRINGSSLIAGNLIGTDPAGTGARGNNYGIRINSGSGNTIGGTTSNKRNLISGNKVVGIDIESGANGNRILGNYIGTNVNGNAAMTNITGVQINGSYGNIIGGTSPGTRNVISGNKNSANTAGVGVYLTSGAHNNIVLGNYIGASADGMSAIPNVDAISINGANNIIGGTSGTTPGGACTGACNVLSGNTNNGITLSGAGTTGTVIQGNYVGTNAAGSGAIANKEDGILIASASNNTVGGTTAAARNIISGNHKIGVELGLSATGNQILGNFIGTNAAGKAAVPNGYIDSGGINNGEGVLLDGSANNNTIGGIVAGAGNLISGNIGMGLQIFPGANGNQVLGNLIGTDVLGVNALGNTTHGVGIHSSNNAIGGTTSGAGNTIAFNKGTGVGISSGTSNLIRHNSIYSNGQLGINLGNDFITSNDPGDGDNGTNKLQNYPVVTSVGSSGGSTTINGTLNSTANTTFSLDLFSNAVCDPAKYGEGQTYLGSTSVTTNASGNVSFGATFAVAVPGGYSITATATDPSGNTSEFSQCVTLGGGGGSKPPAPVLVSPANKATVSTRQVPLSWNPAPRATWYNVVVKRGSTIGTVVFKKLNFTGVQITTSALTAGRTYYWRVRACNGLGCTRSVWWSFKVKAGATFNLLGGDWLLQHSLALLTMF